MSAMGKILVVDDHEDLAENLAEILEGAGYETIIADSAESALVKLGEHQVAALVTDYRLPGQSGADLIRQLRQSGNDTPAIVMSAFTDDETIAIARNAGALEVLAKPVELGRLFKLVSEIGGNAGAVLLVDDNRELAENLADALRVQGYRADFRGSVKEALAATSPLPQVAIVDFRLPDGSGIDVAQGLVARDPRIRILFVSGYGDELATQLRGSLVGTPLLEKPVDVPRLLEMVAAAMKKCANPAS